MTSVTERRSRRTAIVVVGASMVVFALLSAASFARSGRPDPDAISFAGRSAVAGKQVFQAYDCMGCHTLVGNGAYFAPDITHVYADDGPAWLTAFFTQLRIWPTVRMTEDQIARLHAQGSLESTSPAAYYATWTAAHDDSQTRGGWTILMPELHLRPDEIPALVAYLDYVSRLDTQGWPPESVAPDAVLTGVQDRLHGPAGGPTSTATSTPDGLR